MTCIHEWVPGFRCRGKKTQSIEKCLKCGEVKLWKKFGEGKWKDQKK